MVDWRVAIRLAFVAIAGMAVAAEPLAPELLRSPLNLIANPGFEEGAEQPAWWGRHPRAGTPGQEHIRDTAHTFRGQASGLLRSDRVREPGTAPLQYSKYHVPVTGGTELLVSYVVKTAGCNAAGAGLHFYVEDGGHLGFQPVRPTGATTDWTAVQASVMVPGQAVRAGFVLYAEDQGSTWYDEVACLVPPEAAVATATPVVDGRLDEACWSAESALTEFVGHLTGSLPQRPTKAWLAADERHLYVAWRAAGVPPEAALKLEATDHDGRTWLDESVELYVQPGLGSGVYYQISVNAAGVLRDQRGQDTTWESGATVATRRDDDGWTCELALPLEALELPLTVGAWWGVNLVRNDRLAGEVQTWSMGGFHRPRRFGRVLLGIDFDSHRLAALGRQAAELQTALVATREQLTGFGLAAEATPEATALLAELERETAALAAVAAGRQPLPDGGWAEVAARVQRCQAAPRQALTLAATVLFRAEATTDQPAFRVAVVDSLQKVRRSGGEVPALLTRQVELSAARDEAESFQLVVMPEDGDLGSVSIETSPLVGEGGAVPINWYRVDYVETAESAWPAEYVGWWPDPLLPPGEFRVPAGWRQPIWVTATVPPGTTPCRYRGEVVVRCGAARVTVPVELRVRGFQLPRPGRLAMPFGVYRAALAWWWHGSNWRDLPLEVYYRFCRFMAEYRLTPKNIGADYREVDRRDGVRVDLSQQQQTVGRLAWDWFPPYSFAAYRLPSAPTLRRGDHTPEIAAAEVAAHLAEWRRQGFPDQVYIYGYDEPHADQYPLVADCYRAVRQVSGAFPIMQTIGDASPEALVGLVDIWCPLLNVVDSPFYAARKAAGETLWTYVCCSPKAPYPNFFIDQPASYHRTIFWQTRQVGATGLLYWCATWYYGLPSPASGQPHWPEVPIRCADLRSLQELKVNGDGLLIYPTADGHPLPSLRLEVIRDGIEDYEYLALLAELVETARSLGQEAAVDPALLARAVALCEVPATICRSPREFSGDGQAILERRAAVADVIEELSSLLADVH